MSIELNEYTKVELPLIEQLQLMGWEFIEGNKFVPYVTERENFRQVLLQERLRKAIHRINVDEEGNPWLDASRINDAVNQLERLSTHKLMESNQAASVILSKGVQVESDPDRFGGREPTVRFIDFENPDNNEFLAINQFRVDEPGSQSFIVPDVVLFVNGIPLVVIECKHPGITDPIENAITQLLRYSNQRDEFPENEGNEKLFHYNQIMIATSYYEAFAGSIGAHYEHYMQWKDTSPTPMSQVAQELGVESLKNQQILVAGMLRQSHLLDIIRNFTLFKDDTGKTIKIVGRYQQFRAVHKSIHRLTHGQTKREHGEFDLRGGIIWHTQGSGKSLTMVFLIRKMRTLPALRRFKIVAVTDRTSLQKQLIETAELSGESVNLATSTSSLQDILRMPGSDLVFAMIQKYQQRDTDEPEILEYTGYETKEEISKLVINTEPFPVLNESEDILVLIDEAHRSQTKDLHANLMKALPNCAKIAFTGTPIIVGKTKKTHEIFGSYIDRYTILQSEEDKSTVPILYEGKTVPGIIANGKTMDQLFEDMFHDKTPKEKKAIQAKYGTKSEILEAPKMIQKKAKDMLEHYIDIILPNGFKAQVVAVSRLACKRYHEAFNKAHLELIEQLENLDESILNLSESDLEKQDKATRFLVRAHSNLATIKRLEFAAVFSGKINDPPGWSEWSEKNKQEIRIERFKRPLVHNDEKKQDGLAFLIVKSMLLTGFDAPIEQVMYLDNKMKEHELLQAIARVNRTHHEKGYGLIVDYYGVGNHLKEALEIYTSEDIDGALTSIKDELPKLADRHQRCLNLFHNKGIPDIIDVDACVDLLRDEKLRAEFIVKFKQFLESLDIIMPRPEATPYLRDAKILGFICRVAMNLYRDKQMNIMGIGRKVRDLIDKYIDATDAKQLVEPISILNVDFAKAIERHVSPKAKASEMEHAARSHISKNYNQDPIHYKKLSARLQDILNAFTDNWEENIELLRPFVKEIQDGRKKDETGLDPERELPFYDIIIDEMGVEISSLTDAENQNLLNLMIEMVEHIAQEIKVVDFWRNLQARNLLKGWLVKYLDHNNLIAFDKCEKVADQLVELANFRHSKLVS